MSITADLMTGAICCPYRIGMTKITTHSMTSLLSSASKVVTNLSTFAAPVMLLPLSFEEPLLQEEEL
jgi:hypothetical protein